MKHAKPHSYWIAIPIAFIFAVLCTAYFTYSNPIWALCFLIGVRSDRVMHAVQVHAHWVSKDTSIEIYLVGKFLYFYHADEFPLLL